MFSPPHKLNFIVDDAIEIDIQQALQDMDEVINDFHLNVSYFTDFGKSFIKSQGLSPDSFIQMAMQYAFYRYINVMCFFISYFIFFLGANVSIFNWLFKEFTKNQALKVKRLNKEFFSMEELK